MSTIYKFTTFSFILLLLCGCSSKYVKIGDIKYPKSQLAFLKCGQNTQVISIGKHVFPKSKNSCIRIHGYWIPPINVTIGAKYYKQNRSVAIEHDWKGNPTKYRTSWDESESTQYITHKMEPGKKYYIIMIRKGNTATPIIREAGNH